MLFVPREQYPTHRVRIAVLFCRELLGRGHAIDLVMQAASHRTALGRHSIAHGSISVGPTDMGQHAYCRLRRHLLSLWHDMASLRSVDRRKYDAVMVSDKFVVAVVALLVARVRGVRFFFWLTFPVPEAQFLRARDGTARYRGVAFVRGVISWFLLYKVLLRHSDHLFVQSERMQQDICRHGADPSRVTPVLTGVDLKDFPACARHTERAGSELTLAYLGTLSSDRHLEILVDMLGVLVTASKQVRLLLIGDGDRVGQREALIHRATALGVVERLEITGFLPHSDALHRLSGADICLSPFYPSPILDSTSPTKLVEYLALGLPVVANDHPEQRLVLRSCRAGICVPWGARFFARGVSALLSLTPAERSEMGARGRAWVEANRTYKRIADDFEKAYFLALSAPAGNGPARRK